MTPGRRLTCMRHANKPKGISSTRSPARACGLAHKLISRTLDGARLPVRFGRRFRMRRQHNSIGRSSLLVAADDTQGSKHAPKRREAGAWQTRRVAARSRIKANMSRKLPRGLFAAPFHTVKSQKNRTSQLARREVGTFGSGASFFN